MDYWGRRILLRIHRDFFALDIKGGGFGGGLYSYFRLVIHPWKPTKKDESQMFFLILFNKVVIDYCKEFV